MNGDTNPFDPCTFFVLHCSVVSSTPNLLGSRSTTRSSIPCRNCSCIIYERHGSQIGSDMISYCSALIGVFVCPLIQFWQPPTREVSNLGYHMEDCSYCRKSQARETKRIDMHTHSSSSRVQATIACLYESVLGTCCIILGKIEG